MNLAEYIDYSSIDIGSTQTNNFFYCPKCGAMGAETYTVRTCPRCKEKIIDKPGYYLYFPKKIDDKNRYYYDDFYNNGDDIQLTEVPWRESKNYPKENLIRLAWDGHLHDFLNKEREQNARAQALINFDYMQRVRITNAADKKIEELDSKIEDSESLSENIPTENASKIKNDVNLLKEYIKHLFDIETDYYSVRQHLYTLYKSKAINEEYVIAEHYKTIETMKEELYKLRKTRKALTSKKIDVGMIWTKTPPVIPNEPPYPLLKQAGLFNKKKVKAENDELIKAYESKRVEYLEKMRQYKNELSQYEEALKDWETKKQQKEDAAKDEINKQILDLDGKIAKSSKNLKDIERNSVQDIDSSPAIIQMNFIDKEIEEAEKVLTALSDGRTKLYSADIVFPKYRNLVALSCFYEYLMAGRCNSLEGASGAYNIYENEIRTNQIISQLSDVLNSLETIKNNQYLVYSQMTLINKNLGTLNTKMNLALDSLGRLETNTAVTAYNTAITSYYAKKNVELTRALGFLIALS